MNELKNSFIADFLSGRSRIIEIIVVAIFLSLGINLISNGFSKMYGLTSNSLIYLGMGVCFLSILYLIIRFLSGRNRFREYEG